MILYAVEDMDKLFNLGEICGLIRGILYIRCSLLGNEREREREINYMPIII